jgi:hypothetical protein
MEHFSDPLTLFKLPGVDQGKLEHYPLPERYVRSGRWSLVLLKELM